MHIGKILPKIMKELELGMKGQFAHKEPELPKMKEQKPRNRPKFQRQWPI